MKAKRKKVQVRKRRAPKRKAIPLANFRISHDEVWVTKDGRRIEVQDLPESHVKNILRMILRKQRLDRDEAMLPSAKFRAGLFDMDDGDWDQ